MNATNNGAAAMKTETRAAQNAADAIEHIRAGGTAYVRTYTRYTKIDAKCLTKWERAGLVLLKDSKKTEGAIYMASGKSFVYLLPGQLELA